MISELQSIVNGVVSLGGMVFYMAGEIDAAVAFCLAIFGVTPVYQVYIFLMLLLLLALVSVRMLGGLLGWLVLLLLLVLALQQVMPGNGGFAGGAFPAPVTKPLQFAL